MDREKQKNLLRELRGVHKTQAEFAEELGISTPSYVNYETGKTDISLKVVKRIKELYPDIDVNVFF